MQKPAALECELDSLEDSLDNNFEQEDEPDYDCEEGQEDY